jgi:hypothetical protein
LIDRWIERPDLSAPRRFRFVLMVRDRMTRAGL